MGEPTQSDFERLTEAVGEYLEKAAYPDSGRIAWEWDDGEWVVEMRLGDVWTGEDVNIRVARNKI